MDWAALIADVIKAALPVLLQYFQQLANAPRTATTAEADPAVQKDADDAIARFDASGR